MAPVSTPDFQNCHKSAVVVMQNSATIQAKDFVTTDACPWPSFKYFFISKLVIQLKFNADAFQRGKKCR